MSAFGRLAGRARGTLDAYAEAITSDIRDETAAMGEPAKWWAVAGAVIAIAVVSLSLANI